MAKPIVRWGRKATDLSVEMAGLHPLFSAAFPDTVTMEKQTTAGPLRAEFYIQTPVCSETMPPSREDFMSFSIISFYQNFVMNPSAAYKFQASAAGENHASRFKTCDGDTVNISQGAYALLENNMPGWESPPERGVETLDRN